MGQIENLLGSAGVCVDEIARLGVGCGPGSFTGIRVGVAVVRGLALALNVPAVGVSRFAAIHYLARAYSSATDLMDCPITIVLQGFGEICYAQHFDKLGREASVPFQGSAEVIAASLPEGGGLAGSGAAVVAEIYQANTSLILPIIDVNLLDEIDAIALLAADACLDELTSPSPLYLRAPDAKPQINFSLPRQCQ